MKFTKVYRLIWSHIVPSSNSSFEKAGMGDGDTAKTRASARLQIAQTKDIHREGLQPGVLKRMPGPIPRRLYRHRCRHLHGSGVSCS